MKCGECKRKQAMKHSNVCLECLEAILTDVEEKQQEYCPKIESVLTSDQMKIRNIAINTFFAKYRLIIIIVVLILLLSTIAGTFSFCANRGLQKEIDQGKANANILLKEAENSNTTRVNQKINEAAQNVRVNQAKNNHENSKTETNKARKDTNSALNRIDDVSNRDFKRVRPGSRDSKRCEAIPDSPEC